jgi:hypothetical protein
MIYVIAIDDESASKIGYSKTKAGIEKRLESLQTGNHKKLKLIGFINGGISYEKYLHGVLHAHRLHGEWFDTSKPHVQIFLNDLINEGFIQAITRHTELTEDEIYNSITNRNNLRAKNRRKITK